MAFSFSTAGATPQKPQLQGLGGGSYGGNTPASKALSGALQPNSGALKLSPAPAPTGQAIKKQTITDAGGSTHVTEYHPPTPGVLPERNPQQNQDLVTPKSDTSSTPQPNSFPGLISGSADASRGSLDVGKNANSITADYRGQIQRLLGLQIGHRTTGTEPVGEGNAAAVGQLIQGLSAQESQELAGNAQGLTAQNQAQSGLNAAAGQVKPQLAAFNQQAFDPSTSQFSGGSDVMSGAVNNAVNLIKNGSGYANAVATLSQYGPQAEQQLLQALGTGFNVNASNAQAGAQAQNINTVGTATTQANNSVYQSSVQNYATATKQYDSLSGISEQLNETLSNWQNNGRLTNVNQAINKIAGLTSDPSYQQFITALANTQAQYSSILGSAGVIPTQATKDALSVLDPSSSAEAINAALNQLSKDAHALLVQPAYNQVQEYKKQIGG